MKLWTQFVTGGLFRRLHLNHNLRLPRSGQSINLETTANLTIKSVSVESIRWFVNDEKIRRLRRDISQQLSFDGPIQISLQPHCLHRIEEVDSITAFVDVLKHKKSLRKTRYYKRVSRRLLLGRKKGRYRDVDQWARAVSLEYAKIYTSISERGYLRFDQSVNSSTPSVAEAVTVCEFLDGSYGLVDGKHRLVAAISLGIALIPVFIIGRQSHT